MKKQTICKKFEPIKQNKAKTKISQKWLTEKLACGEGVEWFKNQKETEPVKVLESLIANKKYSWANWLIVRVMSGYKQYVSYAVFSAEQVIGIYEKEYPDDKRPRLAIEAARKCIENPSDENKAAAWAAADAAARAAAYAAADAAARAAAYVAAYAADAAAYVAADAAGRAADAAAYVADAAAYVAAYAKMQLKILKYGMELLNEN